MNSRNSIITDDMNKCYICGKPATDIHHCIHGTANREIADQYNLIIGLCRECHERVHHERAVDLILIRRAQTAFELLYGHNAWMEKVGKNFL